jgi:hypothetical protein
MTNERRNREGEKQKTRPKRDGPDRSERLELVSFLLYMDSNCWLQQQQQHTHTVYTQRRHRRYRGRVIITRCPTSTTLSLTPRLFFSSLLFSASLSFPYGNTLTVFPWPFLFFFPFPFFFSSLRLEKKLLFILFGVSRVQK